MQKSALDACILPLTYLLLPAAESYDPPCSSEPMSPATSDVQSHSSSCTAGPEAEPATEPEADVGALESFLHTVTTADEVLNDLLGELSGSSSSSSPAHLSRQSSSALPHLAGDHSNVVTAADSNRFAPTPPADGVSQSSSSSYVQQDAAGIHASSSSAALHSDAPHSELQSPRSITGAVLDTLLEDLRSAELARQSSSSVLLSRLNSLAEMHRRSASSSPVAGNHSQADTLRRLSSSSELPVIAVNCDSADANAHSASSHAAEPSCSIRRSSFSPVAASQQLSSSSSSSCKALEMPDEQDGQDWAAAAAAAAAMRKDAGDEEELDKEERTDSQKIMTSDMMLDELLDDAEAALGPESDVANKVSPMLQVRLHL